MRYRVALEDGATVEVAAEDAVVWSLDALRAAQRGGACHPHGIPLRELAPLEVEAGQVVDANWMMGGTLYKAVVLRVRDEGDGEVFVKVRYTDDASEEELPLAGVTPLYIGRDTAAASWQELGAGQAVVIRRLPPGADGDDDDDDDEEGGAGGGVPTGRIISGNNDVGYEVALEGIRLTVSRGDLFAVSGDKAEALCIGDADLVIVGDVVRARALHGDDWAPARVEGIEYRDLAASLRFKYDLPAAVVTVRFLDDVVETLAASTSHLWKDDHLRITSAEFDVGIAMVAAARKAAAAGGAGGAGGGAAAAHHDDVAIDMEVDE